MAQKFSLKGRVLNLGDAGVEIIVIGEEKIINDFINYIKEQKPNLAHYEQFTIIENINDVSKGKFSNFEITKSSSKKTGGISFLPPDLPICEACLKEIKSNNPRRANYSFTSCVDCGPRFTVIKNLPYDRPTTTMDVFPLCNECNHEYTNPADRRFHAQTTCCHNCGPEYYLLDKKGNPVISQSNFTKKWKLILKLLDEGNIVAIKGIGGTHLACSTTNDDSILTLRKNKGFRGNKPFALLSPNIAKVAEYANIISYEEELLNSYIRPIVLVDKIDPFPLSKYISPNLHNVGVLLPYSGIHHLLSENVTDPALIMTSGNPSNTPILINNEEITKKLANVADYFLLHNREIFQRCDDSVVRVHQTKNNFYPLIIRRSRGYVPAPINLHKNYSLRTVLGLGAEMYNIPAVAKQQRVFPFQHIGHMDYLENYDFMLEALDHQKTLLNVQEFEAFGCDLHPNFTTTTLASEMSEKFSAPYYQFQHHYSHLAAISIDNHLDPEEEIICCVLDGTGYGSDGNIWGGELLLGDMTSFSRIGHLENHILLGGDKAVTEPHRFLLPILSKAFKDNFSIDYLDKIKWLKKFTNRPEIPLIQKKIEKLANGTKSDDIFTSSCGRILDALSILFGACDIRSYEGEPAISLESFALRSKLQQSNDNLTLPIISSNSSSIVETTSLFREMYTKILEGTNIYDLAYISVKSIGNSLGNLAISIAEDQQITKIGLSGGVAYNSIIFNEFKSVIESRDKSFQFLSHRQLPAGDGAIGTGQTGLLLQKVN